MSSFIFLIILLLVLPIIVAVTIIVYLRKHTLKKKALIDDADSISIESGRINQGNIDGLDYEYQYHMGSKNSPSYFKIRIERQSEGKFGVCKESKIDMFFKNLGISTEIQIGDMEFDKKFYIDSETVGFATSYFSNAEKREAVKRIFSLGFTNINYDGKKIEAIISPVRYSSDFGGGKVNKDILLDAVRSLIKLGEDIPKVYPDIFMQQPSGWKAKRLFVMSVAWISLIGGIIATICSLIMYMALDGGALFAFSLKYSIPSLILFLFISLNLLKGRASSHKELIAVFWMTLIGFITIFYGVISLTNGYLDASSVMTHRANVVDKTISRSSKSGDSHYVHVKSWRPGRETEKLSVSSSVYNRTHEGKTVMNIKTKAGKYGFEWIVSYNPE